MCCSTNGGFACRVIELGRELSELRGDQHLAAVEVEGLNEEVQMLRRNAGQIEEEVNADPFGMPNTPDAEAQQARQLISELQLKLKRTEAQVIQMEAQQREAKELTEQLTSRNRQLLASLENKEDEAGVSSLRLTQVQRENSELVQAVIDARTGRQVAEAAAETKATELAEGLRQMPELREELEAARQTLSSSELVAHATSRGTDEVEEMELVIEELEKQVQEEADRAERAEQECSAKEQQLADTAQKLHETEGKLQQTIELARDKVKALSEENARLRT
eukprot:SAG31_NODE_4899_length_2878_cov_1.365599_2_plen_279_part_00